MLALVDGQPRLLNLKEMIHHYIRHQEDVVTRRTRYDLDKSQARAHILEGLLKALDNIDAIVHLIRHSRDTAEAKQGLMDRFAFSDKQAQAILDMRLARLTNLEADKLQAEYDELQRTIASAVIWRMSTCCSPSSGHERPPSATASATSAAPSFP